MPKRVGEDVLKITVPADRQIKRSTLDHILKQTGLEVEHFIRLLQARR